MSWLFLQGQEEVSSEGICWDGERFAPSSGPTTLGGYCLPASETESCLDSRSGMMSKHSTETLGEGESMLSQVDSHARTSAQPAKALESMAQDRGCGFTWPGSFARYDPNSSSWKTPQCSLLEGWDVFLETWPRWGMMRNGECWELSTLAPRTDEIESGLLPTPLASNTKANHMRSGGRPSRSYWPTPTCRDRKSGTGAQERPGLQMAEMNWATPQARDFRTGQCSRWEDPRRSRNLNDQIGGQLNPPWVEWLMGWPIEWTDCEPLGMGKFRQWQQQHSGF